MNTEEIHMKEARILAERLLEAFPWQDTEEGHGYWEIVHDALVRISEKGE